MNITHYLADAQNHIGIVCGRVSIRPLPVSERGAMYPWRVVTFWKVTGEAVPETRVYWRPKQ